MKAIPGAAALLAATLVFSPAFAQQSRAPTAPATQTVAAVPVSYRTVEVDGVGVFLSRGGPG